MKVADPLTGSSVFGSLEVLPEGVNLMKLPTGVFVFQDANKPDEINVYKSPYCNDDYEERYLNSLYETNIPPN